MQHARWADQHPGTTKPANHMLHDQRAEYRGENASVVPVTGIEPVT